MTVFIRDEISHIKSQRAWQSHTSRASTKLGLTPTPMVMGSSLRATQASSMPSETRLGNR
jgi:hypothetical protein